jgi:GNAT superfamily N-acetyltransferase
LLAVLPPFLARVIGAGTYRGWLLTTADGMVVAGAGVQVRELIPRLEVLGGPEALVVNVFVEPAFRRRGLARQLMVAILDWCHAEGIGRIVLHPTDAARPLYESLGFSTSGELIRYQ